MPYAMPDLNVSGQILATPPKGSFGREISFQQNLGWRNIIIVWPECFLDLPGCLALVEAGRRCPLKIRKKKRFVG